MEVLLKDCIVWLPFDAVLSFICKQFFLLVQMIKLSEIMPIQLAYLVYKLIKLFFLCCEGFHRESLLLWDMVNATALRVRLYMNIWIFLFYNRSYEMYSFLILLELLGHCESSFCFTAAFGGQKLMGFWHSVFNES